MALGGSGGLPLSVHVTLDRSLPSKESQATSELSESVLSGSLIEHLSPGPDKTLGCYDQQNILPSPQRDECLGGKVTSKK